MGTSVINPMIFYWMNVLINLDFAVNIVGIGLTLVLFCRVMLYLDGNYDVNHYTLQTLVTKGERKMDLSTKWLIPNIIIVVVCLVITTFIPSRDTMLTMLVADMITYENIELTKESAMALVNYIVEQVEAITG